MNTQANNQLPGDGNADYQTRSPIQPQPVQPISHPTIQPDPPNVTKGVLLILSPFILFITSTIIVSIARLAGIEGPLKVITNILTLLLGTAGVIMVFVGPVLGIIILTKKE